jgi:DNA-binding XRE family transcriptional regulator
LHNFLRALYISDMATKIVPTETLMPRLRELRHVTGTTLEQAAVLVDVHPATLSRWERGESSQQLHCRRRFR